MSVELDNFRDFCSSSLIRLGTVGTVGGICLGIGEYFTSKEVSAGPVLLTAGSVVLGAAGLVVERCFEQS